MLTITLLLNSFRIYPNHHSPHCLSLWKNLSSTKSGAKKAGDLWDRGLS